MFWPLVVFSSMLLLIGLLVLFDERSSRAKRQQSRPKSAPVNRKGLRDQMNLPQGLKTNPLPTDGNGGLPVKTVVMSPLQQAEALGHNWAIDAMPAGYSDFKLIGSGGFADVFSARNSKGKIVAIKMLRKTATEVELRKRYFRREVRLLSSLKLAAFPKLIEHDLDGRNPYFVMEYVNGADLTEHVRIFGPLMNANEMQILAFTTALAIMEIHRAGYLHRDIKPANIMMSSLGVKVIDLGIGKDENSKSTATNTNPGTLAFAAPELLVTGKAAVSSDIFSWGATMGYAMTGLMPYGLCNNMELILRVSHGSIDKAFMTAINEYADASAAHATLAREVKSALDVNASTRLENFNELLKSCHWVP